MNATMQGASLDDLRDLSRRSRRTQRWGFLAALVALLLYPTQLQLSAWMPATTAAISVLAVGALPFVRYAYLAGEERGAYRKIFRHLTDERRTRRLVPEDARSTVLASARAPER